MAEGASADTLTVVDGSVSRGKVRHARRMSQKMFLHKVCESALLQERKTALLTEKERSPPSSCASFQACKPSRCVECSASWSTTSSGTTARRGEQDRENLPQGGPNVQTRSAGENKCNISKVVTTLS
jgi:hypothetical protein